MLPMDMIGTRLDTEVRQGPLVGVLAATSAGSQAAGTTNGGRFTQALIQTLRNPNPLLLDPSTRAMTVQSAKLGAELSERELKPNAYGDLHSMILAWPKQEVTGIKKLEGVHDSGGDWLSVGVPEIVSLSYRQIAVGKANLEGTPDNRVLKLPVHFTQDAFGVRIRVYDPDAHGPVLAESYGDGETQGNDRIYTISLKNLDAGRTYRVIVTPCKKQEACQEALRREIDVKVD